MPWTAHGPRRAACFSKAGQNYNGPYDSAPVVRPSTPAMGRPGSPINPSDGSLRFAERSVDRSLCGVPAHCQRIARFI
jgi:hypothetical protein